MSKPSPLVPLFSHSTYRGSVLGDSVTTPLSSRIAISMTSNHNMGLVGRTKELVAQDHNIQRARRDGARAARALPRAAGKYLVDKVPVVHWAPQYNPRWLANDALAGITIGVMLIPQALAYAKIATISGEYGLMSSWLPNFLYFFMGTSKGTHSNFPTYSSYRALRGLSRHSKQDLTFSDQSMAHLDEPC